MADDRMSGHEARQRMSWGVGIALGMAGRRKPSAEEDADDTTGEDDSAR